MNLSRLTIFLVREMALGCGFSRRARYLPNDRRVIYIKMNSRIDNLSIGLTSSFFVNIDASVETHDDFPITI